MMREQELYKIWKDNVNNIIIATSNGGNAQQKIWFTANNQNQQAICAQSIPKGNCLAIQTSDGRWWLFSIAESKPVTEFSRQIEYKRTYLPKPSLSPSVKGSFGYIEQEQQNSREGKVYSYLTNYYSKPKLLYRSGVYELNYGIEPILSYVLNLGKKHTCNFTYQGYEGIFPNGKLKEIFVYIDTENSIKIYETDFFPGREYIGNNTWVLYHPLSIDFGIRFINKGEKIFDCKIEREYNSAANKSTFSSFLYLPHGEGVFYASILTNFISNDTTYFKDEYNLAIPFNGNYFVTYTEEELNISESLLIFWQPGTYITQHLQRKRLVLIDDYGIRGYRHKRYKISKEFTYYHKQGKIKLKNSDDYIEIVVAEPYADYLPKLINEPSSITSINLIEDTKRLSRYGISIKHLTYIFEKNYAGTKIIYAERIDRDYYLVATGVITSMNITYSNKEYICETILEVQDIKKAYFCSYARRIVSQEGNLYEYLFPGFLDYNVYQIGISVIDKRTLDFLWTPSLLELKYFHEFNNLGPYLFYTTSMLRDNSIDNIIYRTIPSEIKNDLFFIEGWKITDSGKTIYLGIIDKVKAFKHEYNPSVYPSFSYHPK